MKKIRVFILALVVVGIASLIFLVGYTNQLKTQESLNLKGYTDITPKELNEMLDTEEIFLLDTHIPEQQHIKGTDEFIPYNEISENLDKLPSDKNTKIVVYCRSGSMSAIASKELVELGYTNVHNLIGGTIAWRSEGYAFE